MTSRKRRNIENVISSLSIYDSQQKTLFLGAEVKRW